MLHTWGPFEVETDTCAIDPGRRRAVLGADDGCVYVFDTASGATPGADRGQCLRHQEGGHLAERRQHSFRRLRPAPAALGRGNLRAQVELAAHPGIWERSLSFSPDGREILAGTFDGTLVHWDAATGEEARRDRRRGAAGGRKCLPQRHFRQCRRRARRGLRRRPGPARPPDAGRRRVDRQGGAAFRPPPG